MIFSRHSGAGVSQFIVGGIIPSRMDKQQLTPYPRTSEYMFAPLATAVSMSSRMGSIPFTVKKAYLFYPGASVC